MSVNSEKEELKMYEIREKNATYLSHNKILLIGVIFVALIVVVGLICYYVPDRGCERERTNGVTTPGDGMTDPVTGESTTIATPKPSGPWPGRLPTIILPESYDLFLKPYINEDDVVGTNNQRFTFDGLVTIRVRCKNATNRITLHAVYITINSIRVVMMGDTTDIYQLHEEEEVYDFLHIDLNEDLVVDVAYDIEIDYVGQLNAGLTGFYRTSYFTTNGTQVWAATSHMQPTYARRVLPCFDEPDFRAVFNTTIEHRSHMAAITNNFEINVEDLGNNWMRTTYLPTPEMPTYLLAFAVGEFAYTETTTTKGVRLRTWSRPEAVNYTMFALEAGSKILTYFEEYFNINYPLEKQDMIAVPDFAAGAMENWGLIIYREAALLYDAEVNADSTKQRVDIFVSHELAHQWFGNLVTPKWWDDLWLNEGFATYVEYLGVDHAQPTWGMREQFVLRELSRVFRLDSLGASHPIRVAVGAPAEIGEIFDDISYRKGAAILRMLNNILTEEVFTRGLTAYLNEYAYGNADSDDLWNALTEADRGYGNLDVKAIMDTWTLQLGYPLITLERTDRRTVMARQEHFLSYPAAEVSDRYGDLGYVWMVYLQYTDQSQNKFAMPDSVWMENVKSIEFQLADSVGDSDWYIANTYEYGFYRVNYDQENWRRLANQLITNHTVFPNENRAMLIDDAFSLAQSGNVSIETALNLTLYLDKEMDLLPWEITFHYMSYIALMFRHSAGYGPLELYMQGLVKPLYDSLGWEDSDDLLEQYNRNNAIREACFYRIQDCLDRASRLYQEYMENPDTNPISNNLKTIVYCNGIREGGQDEWNFGWNRYLTSADSSEKNEWLKALACSKEPWILNRYLSYTLISSKIRPQDISFVVSAISDNHVGVEFVWDFLRNNYNYIFDLFSDYSYVLPSIISGVAEHFNTQQYLDELLQWVASVDGSASLAYIQGIERMRINIRFMNSYEDVITEWLEREY